MPHLYSRLPIYSALRIPVSTQAPQAAALRRPGRFPRVSRPGQPSRSTSRPPARRLPARQHQATGGRTRHRCHGLPVRGNAANFTMYTRKTPRGSVSVATRTIASSRLVSGGVSTSRIAWHSLPYPDHCTANQKRVLIPNDYAVSEEQLGEWNPSLPQYNTSEYQAWKSCRMEKGYAYCVKV